jgi:hypothetical protein
MRLGADLPCEHRQDCPGRLVAARAELVSGRFGVASRHRLKREQPHQVAPSVVERSDGKRRPGNLAAPAGQLLVAGVDGDQPECGKPGSIGNRQRQADAFGRERSLERGVPAVGYQASSRTGVLVYDTAPGDAQGGLNCPAGNPCSAGWYVVGGTSASCPQWAGLVAIADQIAGHGLGPINPALYSLASGPNYSTYFYDVTTGNNQADPSIPGYPATTGWDPVTGLGTPNAAALVPALAGH